MSVDARQVIDLKIGVSFTRFLTTSVLPALTGLNESQNMLSYGPCQTPTLWFCVNSKMKLKISNLLHTINYLLKLKLINSDIRFFMIKALKRKVNLMIF